MVKAEDAQREDVAAGCRPGPWSRVCPRLARMGLDTASGPTLIVDCLAAASAGTQHEAHRALRAIACRPWSLQAGEAGALLLTAGTLRWQLQPLPPARPMMWRVRRQVNATRNQAAAR